MAADLLGGVGGAYLNKIINIINTILITIAYNIKKCLISYPLAFYFNTIPAIAAPVPLDKKLKNTVMAIICGTSFELNHFIANTDGELIINIYPIAHNIEPSIIHVGFDGSKNIRSQLPIIIIIPPNEQPTRIPNLSIIILHGVTITVCRIGPSKIVRVIIYGE